MNAEQLRARTIAAVRSHRAQTRREFRIRATLLMTAAIAISLGIFFWAGGVRTAPRTYTLLVGTTGGALAIAILSVVVDVRGGRSMLPRPGWQLALLVALVPAALLTWKIAWSSRFPGMMVDWPERPGLRCFFLTLGIGIAPLVSLVFLLRRGEPVRPALVGTAMGILVGAVSWVVLGLWCPVAYPRHLLIGHVGPALLLAMIGACLGRGTMGMGDSLMGLPDRHCGETKEAARGTPDAMRHEE